MKRFYFVFLCLFFVTSYLWAQGESCSSAIPVTPGGQIDVPSSSRLYFSFMPAVGQGGYYMVSSASASSDQAPSNLLIYEENCEDWDARVFEGNSYQGLNACVFFEEFKTYYFVWDFYTDGMFWTFTKVNETTGLHCQTPKTVTLSSSIELPSRKVSTSWFKFVPEADGYYTVGNCESPGLSYARVSVYTEWVDDGSGTDFNPDREFPCKFVSLRQSETVCPDYDKQKYIYNFKKGISYYIAWREGEPGEIWSLTKESSTPVGLLCETAIIAPVNQTMTIDFSKTNFSWYAFVPSEDGVYKVSGSKITGQAYLTVSVETGGCEQSNGLVSIDGDEGSLSGHFYAEAGQKYFLRWGTTWDRVNATFSITKDNTITDNRFCQLATPVTAGTDMVTNLLLYKGVWFKYTPAKSSYYVIKACESSLAGDSYMQCSVYENCNDSYARYTFSDRAALCVDDLAVFLEGGQTYYFEWKETNWEVQNSQITWSLTDVGLEGRNCEHAMAVTTGTNQALNFSGDNWYKFSPQQEGIYCLTGTAFYSDQPYQITAYSGACYNDYIGDATPGDDLYFYARPGEVYYLHMYAYSKHSYAWSLEPSDITDNRVCVNAVTVAVGTSTSDHFWGKKIWFKFTPAETAIYSITSQEDGVRYYIYADCFSADALAENGNTWDDDIRTVTDNVYYAEKGVTYYICWDDTWNRHGTYTWSINKEAFTDNRVCGYAEAVSPGTLSASHNLSKAVWYKFTPAQEGVYSITSCADNVEFELYEGTCNRLRTLAEGENYDEDMDICDAIKRNIFYAKPGITYYVRWTRYSDGPMSYSWKLTKENITDNRICEFAQSVSPAENIQLTPIGYIAWYRFIPSESGNYIISANDPDYKLEVAVGKGNCSSFEDLGYSYGPSLNKGFLLSYEAGQEYFIVWILDDNTEPFQWNLVKQSDSGIGEVSFVETGNRIYPNPTSGIAWLEGAAEPATIQVFNIYGQQIPVDINKENTKISIDLTSVPNGLYLIQVNGKPYKVVKK